MYIRYSNVIKNSKKKVWNNIRGWGAHPILIEERMLHHYKFKSFSCFKLVIKITSTAAESISFDIFSVFVATKRSFDDLLQIKRSSNNVWIAMWNNIFFFCGDYISQASIFPASTTTCVIFAWDYDTYTLSQILLTRQNSVCVYN